MDSPQPSHSCCQSEEKAPLLFDQFRMRDLKPGLNVLFRQVCHFRFIGFEHLPVAAIAHERILDGQTCEGRMQVLGDASAARLIPSEEKRVGMKKKRSIFRRRSASASPSSSG